MTDRQFVKLSVEEHVATVTLDNPPVNALSRAVLAELTATFAELGENPDVRAVVLTGAGQVFVAGADIKDFAGMMQAPEQAGALLAAGHGLMDTVDALPL